MLVVLASGVSTYMGSFSVSLARILWGCNKKWVIWDNCWLVTLSDGFFGGLWSKCRGLPEGCICFAAWLSHPKSKGSHLPSFAIIITPGLYNTRGLHKHTQCDSSHSCSVSPHGPLPAPVTGSVIQSPILKAFLAAFILFIYYYFFNLCEHRHLSWTLPHDACESQWIRWGLCTGICRQTNHQASFWSRESRTDIVESVHFEKSVSCHNFSSLSASVRQFAWSIKQ